MSDERKPPASFEEFSAGIEQQIGQIGIILLEEENFTEERKTTLLSHVAYLEKSISSRTENTSDLRERLQSLKEKIEKRKTIDAIEVDSAEVELGRVIDGVLNKIKIDVSDVKDLRQGGALTKDDIHTFVTTPIMGEFREALNKYRQNSKKSESEIEVVIQREKAKVAKLQADLRLISEADPTKASHSEEITEVMADAEALALRTTYDEFEKNLNTLPNYDPTSTDDIGKLRTALREFEAVIVNGLEHSQRLDDKRLAVKYRDLFLDPGKSVLQKMEKRASELLAVKTQEQNLINNPDLKHLDDLITKIMGIGINDKVDASLSSPRALTIKEILDLRGDLGSLRKKLELILRQDGNGPLAQRADRAETQLAKLVEPKEVALMSFREIVEEITSPAANLDIYDWPYWKAAQPSRNKDLFNAYINLSMKEIPGDLEADLERIVLKVKTQLTTMDNKTMHEPGKATVDRSKLYDQIKQRLIVRREVVMATTAHPEWGAEVQNLLRSSIETAAQQEFVADPHDPSIKIPNPEYNPELTYEILAGSGGRSALTKFLKEVADDNNYTDEAVEFATLLFTSFDMLTIVLAELQKMTKTRGHNGSIEDIDRVLLQDPLASYVHRSQRYGGNEKDWAGWWLLYLPTISEHDPRYGAKGGTVDGAHLIHEIQEMVVAHQDMYFDTSVIRGKIPLMGHCESFFPDTFDMVAPLPGEKIRIKDVLYTVGSDRSLTQSPNQADEEKIADMDLYPIAEKGWNDLLKLTFEAIPDEITRAHIMEETKEGGKGGLLGQWLSTAGQAKMFGRKHLEYGIEPMLTHFIYRLFSHYVGTTAESRLELYHEVVEALKHTQQAGGLAAYKNQIQGVIDNLKGGYHGMSDSLKPYHIHRRPQLKKYLDIWWRKEKRAKPPKQYRHYLLQSMKSPAESEYFRMLFRQDKTHRPLNRSGSMLEIKEGSKAH